MADLPRSIRYLLDTNILSDLIRNPTGAIFAAINQQGEASLCTSIVVACELRFGARKKGSAVLTERVDLILASIPVVPLSGSVDRSYAEIRNDLEKRGQVIGPNDLLIAAQARSLDLTLVTGNEQEFRRVPDLNVENWLTNFPA